MEVIQSKHSWEVRELVSGQSLDSEPLSSATSFRRWFHLKEQYVSKGNMEKVTHYPPFGLLAFPHLLVPFVLLFLSRGPPAEGSRDAEDSGHVSGSAGPDDRETSSRFESHQLFDSGQTILPV